VQRLALRLTGWEATTFLIGEYAEPENRNPVFTVADGVLWLINEVERNSTVRRLRVTKMRGQAALSGLHTFRITDTGVEVYPRTPIGERRARRSGQPARLGTGVPGLDELMGGGIPAGDSVLVTGPTGSGKTILATQFIAEGTVSATRACSPSSRSTPTATLPVRPHSASSWARCSEEESWTSCI
jgi:circadian clock protein KaiC